MISYSEQTYNEVCELLELIGDKYIKKIPKKLLELFEKNRSKNYKKYIDVSLPIKSQINKDTLIIMAILNLKYWCEDKKEKERLKKVYKNNEKKYQKLLNKNINYSDIFKNKIE